MNSAGTAVNDAARLAQELQQFFDRKLQYPSRIRNLTPLAGGASHATWAFDLDNLDTNKPIENLVLRKEFSRGLLASDVQREFALLEYLSTSNYPVPAPKYFEGGSKHETPFIVMARVDGRDIRKVLADTTTPATRESLGHELVRLQARLHQTPVDSSLFQILNSTVNVTAQAEVERWVAEIEKYGASSSPLLMAAMNWLRANLPIIDTPVLVHGDFKTNNLLFGVQGPVVIDWEMAHLGDAYEDLAWTLLWTTKFDLVYGLLNEAQYLAAYGLETGVAVDAARLFFWRIFSLIKLAAIFLSGGAERDSTEPRPQLAMLGRALPWIEHKLSMLLCEILSEERAA